MSAWTMTELRWMIGELNGPTGTRVEEPSAVERAEIDTPEFLAVVVPRDQQVRPNRRPPPPAGHRSPAWSWPDCSSCAAWFSGTPVIAVRSHRISSGGLVEAVDLPFVDGQVVDRFHVAVAVGPERVVARFADSRCDEDRLPQTIGLEVASPGMGVFHLMFFPLATSHSVTARWPSPLPAPASPRKRPVARPVGRLIVGANRGGAPGCRGGAAARASATRGRAGSPGLARARPIRQARLVR